MTNGKKVEILGVPFVDTTMKNLVHEISGRIANEEKTFIVTANPEIVMHAQKEALYRDILKEADYITADGIGIVLAASLLKSPLPERVTGFELMLELLKVANENMSKIYLLGAKEDTLEKTVNHIRSHYPNINIVGNHHGFFDWNDQLIPEQIIQSQPDIIFVALGFPKQEKWIFEHIHQFKKGIFIGIGGSFDVLAGTVKRAPVIWQKLNLEWFYRLIKQPSRWKRMLALPHFAAKVIIKKVSS